MDAQPLEQQADQPIKADVGSGFVVTVRDELGRRTVGLTVVLDSQGAGNVQVTVFMSPEKAERLIDNLGRGVTRCRSGLEVVTNGHLPPIPNPLRVNP